MLPHVRTLVVCSVHSLLSPLTHTHTHALVHPPLYTGINVSVKVLVSEKKSLPPAPKAGYEGATCAGGVMLIAQRGQIKCDNTLNARLEKTMVDLAPQVGMCVCGRGRGRVRGRVFAYV